MILGDIIDDAVSVEGPLSVPVSGIAYDSRRVAEGAVFVALRGERTDGHAFIGEAIRRGARAVVYESGAVIPNVSGEKGEVTWIGVKEPRMTLAAMSHRYFGRPSEYLEVFGVTGTNGKTTTSYLLKAILEAWGKKVGLIGTISYLTGGRTCEASHTTPEAPEFQGLLREMVDARCSHVVTEASSHALSQHRVDHTRFRTCVFTNLTRDHLDYHGSMEDYYMAKERLFSELMVPTGTAVVNSDDGYGRRLAATLKKMGRRVVTYGITDEGAQIRAYHIRSSRNGTRFVVVRDDGDDVRVFTPLLGTVNIYNALAASAAALSSGVPVAAVVKGIALTAGIPGRFERMDSPRGFIAVVDYAHTEDALERVIRTAREIIDSSGLARASQSLRGADVPRPGSRHARGRVITVFGCGGDRDRGKRQAMGAVATRLSDLTVITSDNPRSEDPREIIRDVEQGVTGDRFVIIPDRETAIRAAVELAGRGDVLIVAGKGHEQYQEIKGIRHPFSDRQVLERALKEGRRLRSGAEH